MSNSPSLENTRWKSVIESWKEISHISTLSLAIATSIIGILSPEKAHAGDVETIRLLGDIGQFINPLIASKCAHDKWRLGEFIWESSTAILLSHAGKAIIGDEGIWQRPNGSDEPGFPSSHTTAAASGWAWAIKYCDDTATKILTGAIALWTGYSRFVKDEDGRAPHTKLQVAAGLALPFITEYSGINQKVEEGISKVFGIEQERIDFAFGWLGDSLVQQNEPEFPLQVWLTPSSQNTNYMQDRFWSQESQGDVGITVGFKMKF